MTSRVSSSAEEEDLSLALRSSQLSSDAVDEQVAQARPEGSASVEHSPCPTTPPPALDVSQPTLDTPDMQANLLESEGPTPAGNDARQCTPLDPCNDGDRDQTLGLPQLTAGNVGEQADEVNQRRRLHTVVGGTVITPSEAQDPPRARASAVIDDVSRSALDNEVLSMIEDPSVLVKLLDELGNSSSNRFERQGDLADLNEATIAQQQAVLLTPDDHPDKPRRLNSLGTSFKDRFVRLGDLADLDEAITTKQHAIHLTPDGHSQKPAYLHDLGSCFQRRFESLDDFVDLDEAVMAKQRAVDLTPDSHPSKPTYLNNLGGSLQRRFERLGDLVDLDEAITAKRQAVHLIPDGHPNKPACLTNLGNSFQSRFLRLGKLADLDEAIVAKRRAVHLTLDGHPDKPACLNNLGISMQSRFKNLGDLANIDEAITALQHAVRLTPDGHPDKPSYLNNLGVNLQSRFDRVDDLGNLGEAIAAQQQAVHLTPEGHPDKPNYLNNLGISFQSRFERLGDLPTIDKAIMVQQEAIRLTPDDRPERPGRLNNLGNLLLCRFQRLGDLADLEEAIASQRQAVHLTPDNHPYKPRHLNSLGNSFLGRFERLGDPADIDEVITAWRQAVSLTPDGHADKPTYLSNLGLSFQRQFQCLGSLINIDEAITAQQQAIRLTPDGHAVKPAYLNNLGISLQRRFEHMGDPEDLDEGIRVMRQAIHLTPDDHPRKPLYLNNLGSSFQSRFECLGDIVNLDEAIATKQQALRLTPRGHPSEPGCLDSLGNSFRSRFERLDDITDLDDAITAQKQAVHLSPDGDPDKPMYLSNLGVSFQARFQRLSDLADVDEAITAQQQAANLTPDDHPHKCLWVYNLGRSCHRRLIYQSDDATLARAISSYSQSAGSRFGAPSHRFAAAREWGDLCFSVQSNKTLDAYSTLADLLPLVVWLGRTVEKRYKDISRIGNAIGDAVMAAICFGKLNLALEWIEQGRSIVWGQMLQLRTPLDKLRRHHPDEANELEKISRALDSAGVAYPHTVSQSLEDVAQAHHRLAEDYDRRLASIRNLPGFRDFLRPPESASLCGAALSGPVVIVNAHNARCDALILRPHSSQVCHVPLPGLQLSVVQEMQVQLTGLTRGADTIPRHYAPYSEVGTGLPDILKHLWLHLVEPILKYLKLLQKPTGGELPHITWCLTGPLTFLPIHAAGLYETKEKPKIFDYVVSSYTPTLTALLSAKRYPPESSSSARLLTVCQPKTPGQNPLPGTLQEVDAIQTIQSQTGQLDVTRLDDHKASVAAVLQHMKECNWIHFACHGVQNAINPIDSAFLLADDPLTLKEIMRQSFSHTELAVLSACQTAKGDSELPEEAIHLAAGMQMAGYGSVVATMWSIQDDDAPIIAAEFYKYLIDKASGDSRRAAYALHHAVAHLREVKGEDNFAGWVPFIHLGICSPPSPLT